MGRPKGLRKGPDGKWYMPEQEQAMLAETPKLVIQKPVYVKKQERAAEKFRRNDFVAVKDGIEQQRGIMLGYMGSKAVVQLLDGVTRLTVDDSRIIPAQEAEIK